MNASSKINAHLELPNDREKLANAREEAHKNLGAAAHYILLAQLHLEVADDEIMFLDVARGQDYWRAALIALGPIEAARIYTEHLDMASMANDSEAAK